jgi:hypothetical protein
MLAVERRVKLIEECTRDADELGNVRSLEDIPKIMARSRATPKSIKKEARRCHTEDFELSMAPEWKRMTQPTQTLLW